MKRTCCTHKDAQFVCINEFCKEHCSYVCSLPNDICKEKHEACNLISINYLTKKGSKIVNRQKILNMKELQKVYDQCKKMVHKLQNFLQDRQNALKMKDVLDPHGLLDQQQKGFIINFIKGHQKRQFVSVQQTLLSPVLLQKQLMSLNIQINSYLKILKEENKNFNDQKPVSEINSPLKFQTRLLRKQSEKKEGSAIDKIRGQSKGPTPVRSAPINIDMQESPLKSNQLKKVQNPGFSSSNAFQPKLSPVIKGHIPMGPLFSNITNNIQTLQSFFYQKFKGANLLYRASENDFLVSKFHEKCDGKQNTLTILITEYDRIIGGFTPLPWRTNGDWFSDETEASFIFSLSLGERFPLKSKAKAIWCNNAYGPSFGYPDLEIANKAFYNQNSCVNFPQFYNNGNYTNSPGSLQLFCGSNTGRFRIREWQVYELQF